MYLTNWKDHLNEVNALTKSVKEEALASKEENLGLYVVAGEISNLLIKLSKQTNQLDLFLSQQDTFTEEYVHSVIEAMTQEMEKLDMLLLNSRIESARSTNNRKHFLKKTETLHALFQYANESLFEIKKEWVYKGEMDPKEWIIESLQKTSKKVALLALNNTIEVARSNENAASLLVISDELKQVADTIKHLTSELETILSNQ